MQDFRLENPFTPKSIASGEKDFFGRSQEISELQDNLRLGHVAIHGPVGIGKSSLLARISQIMQGEIDSKHRSTVVHGVCSKEIKTADDAAAVILAELPIQTQIENETAIGPAFLRWVSKSKPATDQTPMTLLRRFVQEATPPQLEYLILAFDQAENCPSALTVLVRTLTTSLELKGCHKLRLMLSGVSPYFDRVIHGDTGLNRVFSLVHILPLHSDDARELLETKFRVVIDESRRSGLDVRIDPRVLKTIVRLSGGHPHLIQLLGSHLIQHENDNPDDLIDVKDLGGAVHRICYKDRGDIYTKIIESLETVDMLRPFTTLLTLAGSKHPTVINRKQALEVVGEDMLKEFVQRDIFVRGRRGELRLVDEFLRLRLSLDLDDDQRPQQKLHYDEVNIDELSDQDLEDGDREDDV